MAPVTTPSVSAQLLSLVCEHEGRTTSELAAIVGRTGKTCSALLRDLRQNGWVAARFHANLGAGCPKLARWYATDKARTHTRPQLPYMDTPALILAALTDTARPVESVADAIGRPYHGVRSAVRRMEGRREVETYTEGGVLFVRKLEELEDDGWTPPAQYVSGTRAVILGLRRAA